MIIISDAHIDDSSDTAADFFRMLAAIEKTDQDVVFLGDIFDLWIGFARYEKELHKEFLTWCRRQKSSRSVGFMEGNHEYFIARERSDSFSWCSGAAAWRDDQNNLFCHGDQINRLDKQYLRFRKAVKNEITRNIIRWLPWGADMGHILKRLLKNTNHEFRKHLPRAAIDGFAETQFHAGVRNVFVGHFHQRYSYFGPNGGRLHVVPGWYEQGFVSQYHPTSEKFETRPWPELIP